MTGDSFIDSRYSQPFWLTLIKISRKTAGGLGCVCDHVKVLSAILTDIVMTNVDFNA